MIEAKFFKQISSQYKANEKERREIIKLANDLIFQAKKIIFKLQRGDYQEANKELALIENKFGQLEKKYGFNRLNQEGSFRAAAEEYLEAKTFSLTIKQKKISENKKLNFSADLYIAGICDLIGELVRYATNQAALGNFDQVAITKAKADDIMSQLANLDLTGYLRTKYDQARGHLRKLEQMSYEIKLKSSSL